jgi:hypothetical protein
MIPELQNEETKAVASTARNKAGEIIGRTARRIKAGSIGGRILQVIAL